MSKIKEIILYYSIKLPIVVSSWTKRSRDLFVFGAWFGNKYSDNSRVLFEYCLERGINAIWITKNKNIYEQLKKQNIPVQMYNSLEGMRTQLRAGVVFYCTSSGDLFSRLLGGAIHVNLWHGVGGGKKIGYDSIDISNRRDIILQDLETRGFSRKYYVTTSDEMKKVFKSAFHVSDNYIIMSGQPRNDMFFDPKYKITSFNPKQFSGKKVITYLPTHRRESGGKIECSKLFNLFELNEFCKKNNCIFVIKKHYYHNDEVEDVSSYTNIIDWTNDCNIDTNELLLVSDYLISDYSSVTADYLLLNRPILYYCYDLCDYLKNDRDMYWPYENITPGCVAKNYEELIKLLKHTVEDGEDEYTTERERVLNMFYGVQARKMVCQDILDEVEKINKKE